MHAVLPFVLAIHAPSSLVGCGSPEPRSYPVTGEIVEVRSETQVVIAHDDIDGFMVAMTMPFTVSEPSVLNGVKPGDQVAGTLILGDEPLLDGLTVTRSAAAAEKPPALAPGEPVPLGALFPRTPVVLARGSPITVGVGQQGRLAVTFVYTRCPLPAYCPLVVSRFQSLQAELPDGARLLAITLDPSHDTRAVLAAFADQSAAEAGRWDFGRVPPEVLVGVAEKAGLTVHGKGGPSDITHDLVLLILDDDGRLLQRYNHMDWDKTEVLDLLAGR